MLSQHLDQFRNVAQQLVEKRQLGQSTAATEVALLKDLTGYAWAVRSRALLLAAPTAPVRPLAVAADELHIRLSVIETLLATRLGQLPTQEDEPGPAEQAPATPAVLQRLATAESRLFHLFGIIPLN